MPSFTNPSMACWPNMSCPSRPINVTMPPARAAPTAWLAPLPPAAVMNCPPRIVSPGRGMRSSLMIMSVFELPTTTMLAFEPVRKLGRGSGVPPLFPSGRMPLLRVLG